MIPLLKAAAVLESRLGAQFSAAYVPGKTLLRNVLCEEFKISEAEAEILCDSLERGGTIRFEESEELGPMWNMTHAVVP